MLCKHLHTHALVAHLRQNAYNLAVVNRFTHYAVAALPALFRMRPAAVV